MPKKRDLRTDRQDEQFRVQNSAKQTRSKGWTIFLLVVLFILFIAIGCNIHPACTQNCQNQPAYFYGVPLPNSSYSQFYGTDDDGNSTHNSSSEEHSSSDDEGGYHGGEFHGGEP